ncbi:MAG TPA: PrsW family glutamic-type intramembrane protease [Ktedonobacterales bacterium]|nr:PrsW family glutamic-type intramembrane protease [Ktedonobacterales bacterium]
MNSSYGVLRVVHTEEDANKEAATSAATTGLGAWDLPGYPANTASLADPLYLLTESITTIGRGLNNHVVLMDPTVSREHARLIWRNGIWVLENLSAQNLLHADKVNIPPGKQKEIRPGAQILLGQTTLQLLAARGERPAKISRAEEKDADSAEGAELQEPQTPPAEQPILSDISTKQVDAEVLALFAKGGKKSGGLLSMSPGVTLQFAVRQRLDRGKLWAVGTIAVVLLGFLLFIGCSYLTFFRNVQLSAQVISHGGLPNVLAAITIPVVPAIGIILLINIIDRFEREPWLLRLGAFLWGALIAIPPALLIEQAIADGIATIHFGWLSRTAAEVMNSFLLGANAGITEEIVKGAGLIILLIALRDEFDNVTDGIIYGALIGAGFAMVENFVYFARDSNQSLLFLIIGRIVLGWLGHSTFTACLGAGLGYARQTRIHWQKWAMPLLGFSIGVLLHTLFDFVDFQANHAVHDAQYNDVIATIALIAIIADYIPPFIAQGTLLYLLMRSLNHETTVIREYLADEVIRGVVTPDEYVLLQRSFRRTRLERYYLVKRGWRTWLTAKALYQTQIGLAFRKWHVSMGDKPKAGRRQPEDAYRERIRQLRQDLAQQSLSPALRALAQ